MALRGRSLLSPGWGVQWWLCILALSALPATTLVPGRSPAQAAHAQRLTFLIPLRGGRAATSQPGDSHPREKGLPSGLRRRQTAIPGKKRGSKILSKDVIQEGPQETGPGGEHTSDNDSGAMGLAAQETGPGGEHTSDNDSGAVGVAADRRGGVGKPRRRFVPSFACPCQSRPVCAEGA